MLFKLGCWAAFGECLPHLGLSFLFPKMGWITGIPFCYSPEVCSQMLYEQLVYSTERKGLLF